MVDSFKKYEVEVYIPEVEFLGTADELRKLIERDLEAYTDGDVHVTVFESEES